MIAYLARYGNQRVPDLLAMPWGDVISLHQAIADLVERENKGSDE